MFIEFPTKRAISIPTSHRHHNTAPCVSSSSHTHTYTQREQPYFSSPRDHLTNLSYLAHCSQVQVVYRSTTVTVTCLLPFFVCFKIYIFHIYFAFALNFHMFQTKFTISIQKEIIANHTASKTVYIYGWIYTEYEYNIFYFIFWILRRETVEVKLRKFTWMDDNLRGEQR